MTKTMENKGARSFWSFGMPGLLCVLAYRPMFRNGFVWDDTWFIVGNPSIRRLWPPAWLLGCPGPGALWLGKRPVTALTFVLDYALWKLNPFGYHLSNLLLHLLCTLGVVCLAKMLLKNDVAAFAAGVLFAVHPGHGEAVLAFAGRSDLLATAFVLLASVFYLMSLQGRRAALFYALSVACFLLGCFSKETALAFLGVYVLLEGIREKKRAWKSALLRFVPFLLVCALYLAFRVHFSTIGPPNPGRPWTKDPVRLAATLSWAFAEYLRLFLFPLRLSPFYVATPAGAPLRMAILLGVPGLLLCLGAFVLLWRRGGREAFGLGWFLLGLAPVLLSWALPLVKLSGFGELPPEILAERWSYLPSVGGCLAIGGGFAFLREKVNPPRGRLLSLVGIALAALLLWRQVSWIPVWRTDESIASAPETSSTAAAFGYTYLGILRLTNGEVEKASAAYLKALEIKPDYAPAHSCLGIALAQQGKLDEAMKEYREAIRLNPNDAEDHFNLGVALGQQGRLDEAEKEYREAIRLEPDVGGNYYNLAGVLILQNRKAEAIELLEGFLARGGQPRSEAETLIRRLKGL